MKKLVSIVLILALSGTGNAATIWINTDLGSYHFDRKWEWNESHDLLLLEYETKDYIVGVASFDNSFGGQTYSAYYGKVWKHSSGIYYKPSLGLAYGYDAIYYEGNPKGNNHNWQPVENNIGGQWAIIVAQSVGYEYKRFKVDVAILGKTAALVTVGFKIC